MLKAKIENSDLLTRLEIAHYEFNSYLDILNDIKSRGYDDEYWNMWKQYMSVLTEYETIKEELRVTIIVPIVGENYPGVWEAKFDTQEIYIYDENGQ